MPTKGRDRCQAVFGRLRLMMTRRSHARRLHAHRAKGGKQRRGPQQDIRVSLRPPHNEAVNELVRARVDELGGTRFATNVASDCRESRRDAGETLPVQRLKHPGDMFDDCFDDARGRLVDPDDVGAEMGRDLIVDRHHGDPAAGAPHRPDQGVMTPRVAIVHHDDGTCAGACQLVDDAGQLSVGHFGLRGIHHQIAQGAVGCRVVVGSAQGLKTEPGFAHARQSHHPESGARLDQLLSERPAQSR